ncbi:UNVERIFIED_CONTAM: Small RNA-binding protein 11, chloroplastic [Sesamum radiatum]|uniref:Small RNA-binding protein 11, chloroplastic n=1 Tax=Sesamum radiatum TaxID=300843 RepID=A0AAW2R3P1_SESRA
MAALRKLANKLMFSSHFSRPNSTILSSPSLLPALFISSRGIASKLFVGGLSFYTTEQGLSEAFSQYGQVVEGIFSIITTLAFSLGHSIQTHSSSIVFVLAAKIVMDRVSDRSKGFGFVTYASEDEAEKAIAEMNGKPLNGRVVFVDYAKPRSGSGSGMPIARGPPEPAPEN